MVYCKKGDFEVEVFLDLNIFSVDGIILMLGLIFIEDGSLVVY